MKQVLLFALVGFSSGVVNLGVYNGVLLLLRTGSLFPSIDFLIAQFFGFMLSVLWAFLLNWRLVFNGLSDPLRLAVVLRPKSTDHSAA